MELIKYHFIFRYGRLNLIGTSGGIKITGFSDQSYFGKLNYNKTNTGYANKTIEQELNITTFDYFSFVSDYMNSFIVLKDGSVKGWGNNSYNQLGDGTSTTSANVIKDCTSWNSLNSGSQKIIKMGCRYYSTYALTNTGKLYVMGKNDSGNRWPGGSTASNGTISSPELVSISSGNKFDGSTDDKYVVDFISAEKFTWLITKSGKGMCWEIKKIILMSNGSNSGLLSNPTDIQKDGGGILTGCATQGISVPENTVTITQGPKSIIMLMADQTLVGWGNNKNGVLGFGDEANVIRAKPLNLPAGVKVKTLVQSLVDGSTAPAVMGFISTNNELYLAGKNNTYQMLSTTNTSNIQPFTKIMDNVIYASISYYM